MDSQSKQISPAEALQRLQEGNLRFTEGRSEHAELDIVHIRAANSEGQAPFATVLGCSDSRVPLELILDQHIGDLFVIRVAGNVVGTHALGSIEFGVDQLHTALLVVMGHSFCGACHAVASGAELHGHIPALLSPIEEAVHVVRREQPQLSGDALLAATVTENVWQSIADILRNSPVTCSHVQAGRLKIKGAVYDIESGAVEWLGPHPQQAQIISEAG
jgi:carbonic anhydrase